MNTFTGNLKDHFLKLIVLLLFELKQNQKDIPIFFHLSVSKLISGNMLKLVKTNCKSDFELFSIHNKAATGLNSLTDNICLLTIVVF